MKTSGHQNLTVDPNSVSSALASRSTFKKNAAKFKKDQKENYVGSSQNQLQTSNRNKKLDILNYTTGIDILQAYKLKYKDVTNNKPKQNFELKKNYTGSSLAESKSKTYWITIEPSLFEQKSS